MRHMPVSLYQPSFVLQLALLVLLLPPQVVFKMIAMPMIVDQFQKISKFVVQIIMMQPKTFVRIKGVLVWMDVKLVDVLLYHTWNAATLMIARGWE